MLQYIKAKLNSFGIDVSDENISYSVAFCQSDNVSFEWKPLPGDFDALVNHYGNFSREKKQCDPIVVDAEVKFIRAVLGLYPYVNYVECKFTATQHSSNLDLYGLIDSIDETIFFTSEDLDSEYMGVVYKLSTAEVNRKRQIWDNFIKFCEMRAHSSCDFIYQKLSSISLLSYVEGKAEEIYRRKINSDISFVIEKMSDEYGTFWDHQDSFDADENVITEVEEAASGNAVYLMLKGFIEDNEGNRNSEVTLSNYLNLHEESKNRYAYLELAREVFGEAKELKAAA